MVPPLLIFILAFIAVGFPIQANAQKRAHRPWFSHQPPSNLAIGRTFSHREKVAEPDEGPPHLPLRASSPHGRGTFEGHINNSSGEKVTQQALRYRGTKYRFGGTNNKKGFDCSGLVMRIYNDLKFKRLPHTSAALYRMGNPVSLRELRPGDLVFFKNTYKRGVSHVGIYTGKNRFIHAANHRHGVTITSLADPYYQLHYAGARRLY